MAEKWEVCELNSNWLQFFLSKGYMRFKLNDFIRANIPSFNPKEENEYAAIFTRLLSDGWEPYAMGMTVVDHLIINHCFRRKVNT